MFLLRILKIFGKAVICKELEIASQYARQNGLNAVTIDGEKFIVVFYMLLSLIAAITRSQVTVRIERVH